jgi:hypothetical protein
MRAKRWWAVLAGIAAVAASAPAADVSVPVTVREAAGVARAMEPAVGGVPFKKGQVKDVAELVLVDAAGKSVPAQFTKLASYADGSVQWALVDLVVPSLMANGAGEYRVVSGKAAEPASPLKIAEAGDKITLDTGVATFTVDKVKFNLLDAVTVGGKKVAGNEGLRNALAVVDGEGTEFVAGAPTKVSWEYRGPVRATLRLDGPYVDVAGKPFISYTTRLTAWAGLGLIRVNHSLRNSDPKEGFDAKIKQATLTLKLDGAAAEGAKGDQWVAAGSLLLVNRNAGGCFPGGSGYKPTKTATLYRQEIAGDAAVAYVVPPADTKPAVSQGRLYGYDQSAGVFALADLAHKDQEVFLDFHDDRRGEAAEKTRQAGLLCFLHVMPADEWLSETETLGSGKFGTLADEVATYKAWGWKGADDPRRQPNMPHAPDAYVAKELIHNESEVDNAESFLLSYCRTGQRGFLDWGRAWSEFDKTHYAYRTDGFAFGSPRKSTALKLGWYGPQDYGWNDSRAEACHFYGRGVIDYYCLTGDVDALETARDMVECLSVWKGKEKPGDKIGHFGVRGYARSWLSAIRMAQLTGDPGDRKVAGEMAECVFKAADWDARGFIYWGAGSAFLATHELSETRRPKALTEYMSTNGLALDASGKVTDKSGASWPIRSDGGTWQQATLAMALERYYRLCGNEEAKKLAIRLAEFGRDCEFSRHCQYAYYKTILDFPLKGGIYDPADWDPVHKDCPNAEGGKHDGNYTRFMPDLFARAYSLTGDKQWLDVAKKAWNRGSKRGFMTTKPFCGDDEVHKFAWNSQPKDDNVLTTCRMFYEVPRAK